ncbi:Os11g0517350, partial [Oryza sativa Japonica Group]
LAKSCFDFLGYFSSVPINCLLVRNQMLENSFLIDTQMKNFDTKVPVTSLIESLAKAQFCSAMLVLLNLVQLYLFFKL